MKVCCLRLPSEYPFGISWVQGRPVGQAAYEANERGVGCRSAAETDGPGRHLGEELVLFDRSSPPETGQRLKFMGGLRRSQAGIGNIESLV